MSVEEDVLQELVQRVTALEQQLASLQDELKRGGQSGISENTDLECMTPVPVAEIAPIADAAACPPFARESPRFRRRRFGTR
jgi:hypothetical protein